MHISRAVCGHDGAFWLALLCLISWVVTVNLAHSVIADEQSACYDAVLIMSGRIGPTSGVKLFQVVAVDGRTVCLHEEWYHVHILQRKPEIARLANPLQEIERALTHAVDIRRSTSYSTRPVYIGPAIGRGFFRDECLHVAVQPTASDRGFVITVVMRKAAEAV